VNGNERNGPQPIAGDTHRLAATRRARPAGPSFRPSSSSPAPPVPLLLRDPTSLVRRSRRKALILLTGIVLLSNPAVPAAADPPADGARPQRFESRFTDDRRLDQKLSLSAWAEPLEDVLALLRRETGVQVTFEGRDVGDQRVSIVQKEQPLRRVQALLAETLDLYWRRDRKAPAYRYVLFQDLRSRKLEQELLSRARLRYEEGIHRNIDALKLTPAEIEELRPRNPVLAQRLTEPDTRKALEILGRVTPRYWEPLMQTGRVEIPYTDLSARDQEMVREYGEIEKKRFAEIDLKQGTPGKRRLGDIAQPGGRIVIHLFDGGQPTPYCEACVDFTPADGTVAYNFFGPAYTPEELRLLREEFLPPRFEKPKRATPEAPGPRVTVTWKPKERLPWEDVLKAVVESADLQVVADSYLYYWHESSDQLPRGAAVRDRPLAELLDQVAPPFFYEWRREGDVYLFRHRNWFHEKQHNIPERDLRRWRGHLEGKGRLWLEDLAEMALLTESQFRLLYHTPIPSGSAGKHQEVLKFYAALNPLQRAQLETTGQRLRELNPRQLELLRAWKPAATLDGDARLRLRREPEAVLFVLTRAATAPQEERVPLEPRRPLTPD
jgi:hypothetical protein